MRLEHMSVVLRERTPWEAMDLGMALARRHAAAAWMPWLVLSLPMLALTNLLAWGLDRLWLAPLLMWWLLPWFERAPLYVLSRAVFGQVPALGEVLRAPSLWRPGSVIAWLTLRRLHPARALLLPVDLLENLTGARRRHRAGVLQRAVGSQAWALLAAGLVFVGVLVLSLGTLLLLFVPVPLLDVQAQLLWELFITSPPAWAQVLVNVAIWAGFTAVGPLVVGAGFGLYLHRRTQLEAWDVELVFRRLAARLREAAWAPMLAALALLALACAPPPAWAAAAPKAPVVAPQDARAIVGEADYTPPDPRFGRAIDRAYADPDLSNTREVTQWRFKFDKTRDTPDPKTPAWMRWLGAAFALLAEYGLWILAALVVAGLLWTLPRWLPWVREQSRRRAEPSPILEQPIAETEPLPPDVAASAQALWQAGQLREALALLYRASVEEISRRLGAPFPPGATEAECLRRARRLPEAEAVRQFGRIVSAWQAAAYAWRFPDGEAFARLLDGWRRQFGSAA